MEEEINASRVRTLPHPGPRRFYRTRHRISTGLMIFVVAAGLPILAVPALRHRLSDRVMALKSAIAGGIRPVTLQVGADHGPFPTEFASPLPQPPQAPQLPDLNRVFTMDRRPASLSTVPAPPPRASARRLKIEAPAASVQPDEEAGAPEAVAPTASAGEPELKYQKGKSEQEAYELLLKLSPNVAALVQGSDPSLKFKSWDAASRGEDTFWVRLKLQSEGNPEAEYIWQVKVQANQATPLNYNARSLSQ